MKLFLASHGIQPHLAEEFRKLLSKPANEVKFAYITNAADPYPPENRAWMNDVVDMFESVGLNPKEIDLREYKDPNVLKEDLSKFDVIWCGGGNTWYLRYVMETSGFAKVMKDLIESGIVYGGDSAGAIIIGPTLKYVDLLDEPNEAPQQIEEGLGVVNFVIVPHWNNRKYKTLLTRMRDCLISEGFEVRTLTDEQAIVVNDKKIKTI